MMTFKTRRVTGGVDTHGDVHVAVAVDSVSHRRLGVEAFPASTAGYVELLAWFCSFGELDPVGVESTGSYGAGLTRFLVRQGVSVVEVNCPDRRARRFNGKDDPTDAEAAARAVLAGTATAIPKSGDGPVEAIRALEITYHSASKDRTRAINQFKALLVSAPAALREHLQQHSFHRQLQLARRFHDHHDDLTTQELRWALKELARRIGFLDDQLGRLNTRINTIAADTAPALIGMPGVGPHVAAQLLAAAGDNPDRMRSQSSPAVDRCPRHAPIMTQGCHRVDRSDLLHQVLVTLHLADRLDQQQDQHDDEADDDCRPYLRCANAACQPAPHPHLSGRGRRMRLGVGEVRCRRGLCLDVLRVHCRAH
jgi:transposase